VLFSDRVDAGRQLARKLRDVLGEDVGGDIVVTGLPRGGVPVALEVARVLRAPLDVIVVRKLGAPYQPELGFGAIGEEGTLVMNPTVIRQAGITDSDMRDVQQRERDQLERRLARLRAGRPPVPLDGKTVIVVDDGVATGSTARAACRVARARGARRVILGVPVAPPDAVASLRGDADEVVCPHVPPDFIAIGEFYADFGQLTDDEVTGALAHSGGR
jgi:putative phosphoribosyl transferase